MDWFPPIDTYDQMFAYIQDAGFVRYHPEDGQTYMDDSQSDDVMAALLETGTPDALEAREMIKRMREEGDFT